MRLIWSFIVGIVIGALARVLMPVKDRGGVIITALLGMAGSVLAVLIGRAAGLYRGAAVGQGLMASILGAMIVLAAYRATLRRPTA